MIKPQTLKGFRDFLPKDARKRQYVIDILKETFEKYGFEPLETPVLEYEEVLTGKYGEEGEKLMYRFEDNGGRRVAMRYDQTVPLARVVAEHASELPVPFKRYQIQNVWRADKPQKGRYREFLQCDIDAIGANAPTIDAEIIACVSDCLKKLGMKDFELRINHRDTFLDLMTAIQGDQKAEEEITKILAKAASISIDKLEKIGKERVFEEMKSDELLQKHLFANEASNEVLHKFLDTKPFTLSESHNQKHVVNPVNYLKDIIETAMALGVDEKHLVITPTLARGLDYYTDMIFEVVVKDYPTGSIGGGGRYDGLINMFVETDEAIPAVGFAFGFDRVIETMDELRLFPADLQTTKAIITTTSPSEKLRTLALELAQTLRKHTINTETFFVHELVSTNVEDFDKYEKKAKEKLFKYTDQKSIPYAVLLESTDTQTVMLRNLKTREQKEVSVEELIRTLKEE